MRGMESWAVHFAIIFSLRFMDSILDSFWVRFGLVLGYFWELNSSQVGTNMHLEVVFFENVDFHEIIVKPTKNEHSGTWVNIGAP